MAHGAKFFLKHSAEKLVTKWSKPYGVVMGWIQARLHFAVNYPSMPAGVKEEIQSAVVMDDGAYLSRCEW